MPSVNGTLAENTQKKKNGRGKKSIASPSILPLLLAAATAEHNTKASGT